MTKKVINKFQTTMTLTDREYKLISRLVYDKVGIKLGDQKRALIVGRLQKILRQNNFTSFTQYYEYVNADETGVALSTLLDRISTNHTFFYRENDHFKFFSEAVLPQIAEVSQGRDVLDLRIWCAGCSSGEEPYTLAMLINEFAEGRYTVQNPVILATDISAKALEKAVSGVYNSENVSRMPPKLKHKYFNNQDKNDWSIVPAIRDMVMYKRFNLMQNIFPFNKRFHIIFCRNVMIYFDEPTRQKLVGNFYRHSVPGSFLFIGHSESIRRNNAHYNYIKPAIYQRNLTG